MPDLTPEELAKKQPEAIKAAQETLDRLTPEERAKAEVEGQKLMEQMAAEHQRKMDLIAQDIAKITAKEAAGPRFCTNCGNPL